MWRLRRSNVHSVHPYPTLSIHTTVIPEDPLPWPFEAGRNPELPSAARPWEARNLEANTTAFVKAPGS